MEGAEELFVLVTVLPGHSSLGVTGVFSVQVPIGRRLVTAAPAVLHNTCV